MSVWFASIREKKMRILNFSRCSQRLNSITGFAPPNAATSNRRQAKYQISTKPNNLSAKKISLITCFFSCRPQIDCQLQQNVTFGACLVRLYRRTWPPHLLRWQFNERSGFGEILWWWLVAKSHFTVISENNHKLLWIFDCCWCSVFADLNISLCKDYATAGRGERDFSFCNLVEIAVEGKKRRKIVLWKIIKILCSVKIWCKFFRWAVERLRELLLRMPN